jgi:phage terminase small subunit
MAKPKAPNAAIPADRPLTPQQERYCQEFLIDLNQSKAAIRAKYGEKNARSVASHLMDDDRIQKRIQSLMDERKKRTDINADYVLNKIQETVERCSQAEPVRNQFGQPVFTQGPDGELAAAYRFDSGGVLKGCELLGKHLKLFTEKHEHSGKDGGPIEFSDSEAAAKLAAILNAARERKAAD